MSHVEGPPSVDIAALSAAVADHEGRFRALMMGLQVGIIVQGARSEILLFNAMALELLGMSEDQLQGKSSLDPSWDILREDGSCFLAEDRPVLQAVKTRSPVRDVVMGIFRPRRGDRVWLLVSAIPQLRDDGSIVQVVATFTDITRRKKVEETLQAQSRKIAELSTPLIPLDGKTVLMPLVGTVDRARIDQVREVLLQGVWAQKAEVVLLDVTGVPGLDADAADGLRACAGGLRLLGARCIVTGIQPAVAIGLLDLGVQLDAEIHATLERGLAAARQTPAAGGAVRLP